MKLQEVPGAPKGFPFAEKNARTALGLNKDEARALRKKALTEEDWVYHKKQVLLSAEGVRKLAAAAETSLPEKAAPVRPSSIPEQDGPPKEDPEKKAAAPDVRTEEVVTLRVVRSDLANARMLLACEAGEDPDRPSATVRVRVRETKNFVRRMEIPARLVEGYADLYELARALPRQRGKW